MADKELSNKQSMHGTVLEDSSKTAFCIEECGEHVGE